MQMLDTILTQFHILAGVIVLLTGLINMLLRPKGGLWHKRIGMAYLLGMFTISFTAIGIIVLFRFNLFLLVISIFSFYLCFSGYRVLKRKKPGQQTWIDWTGLIIAAIAGAGLVGIGAYNLLMGNYGLVYILCVVFGYFTLNAVKGDLNAFRAKGMEDKMWWWYHHMQAMIGSYIAAVTAFAVQNGDKFAPNFEQQWLFWLLPPAIGTTAIVFWVRYYQRKFNSN